MAKSTVNWYGDEVILEAIQAVNLPGIALRVEERTKINIVDNDQVDTGFMLNAVYIVTEDGSGYSAAKRQAGSKNLDGKMGPEIDLGAKPGAGAAVVGGAEYTIYQEFDKSFLLKAAQETGKEIGGIVKKL